MSGAPSDVSSQTKRKTKVQQALSILQDVENFDIWDFVSLLASSVLAGPTADSTYKDVASLLYQAFTPGDAKPRLLCALRGAYGGTADSCHVVPSREQGSFRRLVEYKIVPASAHHLCAANLIKLCPDLHEAWLEGSLDLLPTLDQVVFRLVQEFLFFHRQHRRAAVPGEPEEKRSKQEVVRPSFDDFYKAAESEMAVVQVVAGEYFNGAWIVRTTVEPPAAGMYALPRTEKDLPDLAGFPPFPHLLLPISLNLLIYATLRRIQQRFPALPELQESSRVVARAAWLLSYFWDLKPTDHKRLDKLLNETKLFINEEFPPESPFTRAVNNPHEFPNSTSLPRPDLPLTALTSMGNLATVEVEEEVLEGTDAEGSAGAEGDFLLPDVLFPFTETGPEETLQTLRVSPMNDPVLTVQEKVKEWVERSATFSKD